MKALALAVILSILPALAANPPGVAPPDDPHYNPPSCDEVGGYAWATPTIGQWELTSCLSLQRCSLWERESCEGADVHYVNYSYDQGGSCHFHCVWLSTGESRYGITTRIWSR